MKTIGGLRPVFWFIAFSFVFPLSSVSLKKDSYLFNIHQFLFRGKRSGEAYFNRDGSQMVFQAEGEEDNPFYQIYTRDMKTGEVRRISLGWAKTTCAWPHYQSTAEKPYVLFASTHGEGKKLSLEKQKNFQAKKNYAWDYDSAFDLYEYRKGSYKRLTSGLGYDAEGSYSPDGRFVVFSSNAWAYRKFSRSKVDKNPSFYLDLFLMELSNKKVLRLTHTLGYDGGAFFSPDGKSIVWRRFSPKGRESEIFNMKIDGSEVKQLTHLKTMSWAPFYHPSGEYIIFTTALHGHRNFELYVVDVEGVRQPLRITYNKVFDGLPVFHPNGKELFWVQKRKQAHVYKAIWNHRKVQKDLRSSPYRRKKKISQKKLKEWVYYLASKKLRGRNTGSLEEKIYSQKLKETFKSYGLQIFPSSQSAFDVVRERKVLSESFLKLEGKALRLKKQWMPISASDSVVQAKVVFSGYGLDIPKTNKTKAYRSYKHKVKGHWALILDGLPENLSSRQRSQLYPYSHIEQKMLTARKKGAKGLLVATKKEFFSQAPLHSDSFPVVFMPHSLIEKLKGKKVSFYAKFKDKITKAHNTLAFLKVKGAQNTVIVGAHGDHLGHGAHPSSFDGGLHYGADDNASGVAGLMELAFYFSRPELKNHLKQNILFAVWSGEELGLLGSRSFVEKGLVKNVSAYVNMDMIGRMKDKLYVQGLGSSSDWKKILKKIRIPYAKFSLSYHDDVFLPTDTMSFYDHGICILNFFTGVHEDYHKESDQASKINFQGLLFVTETVRQVVEAIAKSPQILKYEKKEPIRPYRSQRRVRRNMAFQVSLGTVPDYAYKKALKISLVRKKSPASKAGLQKGDIIVKLGSVQVKNLYDYVYALSQLKPLQKVPIEWLRGESKKTASIFPEPRQH